MLLFIVLATLLCSSLVDAVQAPVKSTDALQQCKSQSICDNAALDIDAEFHPAVKASPPGEVKLRVAVQSNQLLTFLLRAEKYSATWEITRPAHDECVWKIGTERDGTVTFKDYSPSKTVTGDSCFGSTGRDVSVTVDVKGKNVELADVTDGSCKKPIKLSACDYTLPDSTSIPDRYPTASIKLTNAFVVYNAPDTTTTMPTTNSTGGPGNATATNPGNPENSDGGTTPAAAFGGAMMWGLVGGCVLFFVLFVIVLGVAIYACIKLKKPRSPRKEEPRKKEGLDDRSKPIPLDGNGIVPEIAICESKSKRMVDEKQVAAAEAQNPAPGETPTELKSQQVTNKGPDGTSTQPAADPTDIV